VVDVTHLSVKTLRHYHEAGLLAPERIDRHSGYRYYSTDQVPTAQVIRRFRDLDMPVRDIVRLLGADVGERPALIADHLSHLEQRLAATTEAVGTLRRLLVPDPPRLEVVHRDAPARRPARQRVVHPRGRPHDGVPPDRRHGPGRPGRPDRAPRP
jgi:DNA-binding transcriptional MerR regulator